MRTGRRSVVWLLAAAAVIAISAPRPQAQGLALSHSISGGVTEYVVQRGDSLAAIAARVGVDAATIAADNGLDRRATLREQQRLRIDARHITPEVDGAVLVINVPQRRLFFKGDPATSFPVAVGRNGWPTPLGRFTVVLREEDPTWDVPESILEEARQHGRELPPKVPPGPDNPLGKYWIGLSGDGIGVHGTNAPRSIYQATTHGCIRLHPDDIAWLFPRVAVKDAVTIVYQSVLMADAGGRVFLEAHRDLYGKPRMTIDELRARAREQGLEERVDWTVAAEVLAGRQGVARDVTRASPPA